jgi:hypothetical protein
MTHNDPAVEVERVQRSLNRLAANVVVIAADEC